MNRSLTWPILNALAVAATIAVNGLANALPFNNQTTAAISDRFPVFFTPAGYVFAIWGLIYLALILFAIFPFLPGQRGNPRLARIGPWFRWRERRQHRLIFLALRVLFDGPGDARPAGVSPGHLPAPLHRSKRRGPGRTLDGPAPV
jgi:hypothetical protein